ncbi:acyl-CoA dehydrogenase [Pollutimonas subterranea]|uniref:Acyl-CoA dehydrogenase n=1 Tax=Pollutimonas subterranea TaxID=2045210 RepID=A0A2N4U5T1_9BURK|nr:acyl-CoA dehydrogenase family protein [Pollutimonas subterranea]PLC50370.1 acyl-CoA dehydrogenase [Pollutimonas subterranea]
MNTTSTLSAGALRELRSRVRNFIDQVAIPLEHPELAQDVTKLDAVTTTLRKQAKEAGIYAPQLPCEWGGLGLNWVECAAIFEEAGRGLLGPLALNCAPPDQPNMLTLLELGTTQQKERYLLPLARGEKRACFAMTEPEPGAGSDPGMLSTWATRQGSSWVLNGHKIFISGGVGADFALLLAQTSMGPTLFIIDTHIPGYNMVRDVGTITGYQAGGHAEILLENCQLTGDAVLGEPGRGLQYAQLRLEPARLSHCMRFIGRASRAMEIAQDYVCRRSSFGSQLSDLQQIQAMVADSHIDLHASRLMTRHCAELMDSGTSVKHESSMTKVFVSEAVNRVTDRAMQMLGALGVSDETPVSMLWREARPFRIYDGANELHRATLGIRILKYKLLP